MKIQPHFCHKAGFVQFILLLLFLSLRVYGFDNNLKGFILSGAAGVGEDIIIPYIEIDTSKGHGNTRFNTAVCLDLRIGYNFGNRFEFAYVNKSDFMYPYTTAILNNTNVLELSYYVRERAPSVFINGSAGGVLWLYPLVPKINSYYGGFGFCFSLGTGIEFIKHVSAVLEYQFSRPGYYDKPELAFTDNLTGLPIWKQVNFAEVYNTNVIRLTLRYTFY